jgi:hypothetical protein
MLVTLRTRCHQALVDDEHACLSSTVNASFDMFADGLSMRALFSSESLEPALSMFLLDAQGGAGCDNLIGVFPKHSDTGPGDFWLLYITAYCFLRDKLPAGLNRCVCHVTMWKFVNLAYHSYRAILHWEHTIVIPRHNYCYDVGMTILDTILTLLRKVLIIIRFQFTLRFLF